MDENDDISQWAASLTPDGSPGAMSQQMRALLGDKGYEKAIAQNDSATALYLQKQTRINDLLSVIVNALTIGVFFGVLFGLVGIVAAIAVVIRIIF